MAYCGELITYVGCLYLVNVKKSSLISCMTNNLELLFFGEIFSPRHLILDYMNCRVFEVRCMHIPVHDRTPFEGFLFYTFLYAAEYHLRSTYIFAYSVLYSDHLLNYLVQIIAMIFWKSEIVD